MKIEMNQNTTTATSTIGKKRYNKTSPTQDLLAGLVPTEMLPVSVRWIDQINQIYVLEYPPQTKIITLQSIREGPTLNREYAIPIPWQIYICQISGFNMRLHMFMRTQQLTSLDDTLNHHHMTNIYRDGSPCAPLGDITYESSGGIELCREMIDMLWMSAFNGGNYMYHSEKGIAHKAFGKEEGFLMPDEVAAAGFHRNFWIPEYYQWLEQQSIEDVLQWNWKNTGSLRTLIDHLTTRKSFEELFRLADKPDLAWAEVND